ncbi:MAG: DUF3105 domain-containing protein, partial [Actinobacteria bacterium]|nr:DUF3105 domain-containing protein [Actinomycetota bacterium]
NEIVSMRAACGDAHLKVILGTGDLSTLRNVMLASMVAMMAGADFIKTSTGKESVNATPPVGGNHAPVWADCTGTVYPNPIADENAMHSFEHGAVWITYQPALPAAQVKQLAQLVTGQDYTFMSPYPGQRSRISVSSWGYQLAVASPDDPRLAEFIGTLRKNPATTPEPGASCANASFKANPSTPGHPAES